MEKKCPICKKTKQLASFGKYTKAADWLQYRCKECKREYDNQYHKLSDQKYKKRKNLIMSKRRKFVLIKVWEYALEKWCTDCWYNNSIAAMQFDHKRDKSMNISNMISSWYWLESIFKEIGKCEVVCANCHMIRTAKQFDWY